MKRIMAVLLSLVIALTAISPIASAAPASAKEVKRAIAIVFDNSGSMYLPDDQGNEDGRRAWCRATYAMEAFATMMNPSDIMQIYPMHEITVGGGTFSSENPLTITQSTAAKIREIYTPNPLGTPIETITTAFNGLMAAQADEKWLVVLTDGAVFSKNKVDLGGNTKPELEKVLTECNKNVNIMYLGIGSQTALPENISGEYEFFAEKTQNSAEVLSTLSSMCNIIFGRDLLPKVEKKVSFDVPMSKLILFVQGEGIKNVKLGDLVPSSSNEMRFSTKGGGGQAEGEFWTDETLQGIMVIYNDVEAGEYPLSYSGTASSVDCYYEPDVDLAVTLLDAEGAPVDVNADLMAGSYTLQYGMVDKQGTSVVSKLLGNTEYEIMYSINGTPKSVSSSSADKLKIDLKPNDVLEATIRVTYLGGYTITRTSKDLGWPTTGLTFIPPPAGMLEATIQGADSFNLSTLASDQPFRVDFIYEGNVCTGEQLERLENLQAKIEGGNVQCRIFREENGVFVALDYNGTALETDCGKFELQVTGVYRNEDGLETNTAVAATKFSVIDNSRHLEMMVDAPQSYYQISQLENSEPILVKLAFSGDPLTKEELDRITISCDVDGAAVIAEPDYANSAYKLRFDPENPPSGGKQRIKITAAGTNEIGEKESVDRKINLEFGTMPTWLRTLIPILGILVLLAIAFLILNQKVLPKNVYVREMEFNVGGESIDVKRSPVFDGAGKSRGSIKIYSPKAGNDPFAEQAIFLTVSAISPRRTPSKQRKARVTNAQLKGPQNVIYWKVKTQTFEPDPEKPGGFINTVTGTPGFKSIDIGPTTDVEIQAETEDSSVIFRCKIGFR